MESKKLISIVTPCFNEAANLEELYMRIRATMLTMGTRYEYEHIIIDNASTDDTVAIAKGLASTDPRLKIIVNTRNFGPVRSPYYGIIEAYGDAVVLLAADLQDPPELIVEYVKKWEEGFEVVMPTKAQSEESVAMQSVRKAYYRMLNSISEVPLEEHATGAGLYDKKVIDTLRKLPDPYPYFRGLVCDLGYSRCTVSFVQPVRKRGVSKANFYGMFDQALLAMTKHSKLPLRMMTFLGLGLSILSLLASFVFLVLKLMFWNSFNMGMAPLLVGLFFLSSMQFFFLGILGEYVGMILTQVRNMPLVIEKERINFAED
jgi:glycosyltransferase involved in cell wall biosynthesis